MNRTRLLVASFLAASVLLACGPGPTSLTPVNCKLQGYAQPTATVVVDSCASGQICAVIDEGDAGTSFPICMKPVACAGLSCSSNQCAEGVETSPATTHCIK